MLMMPKGGMPTSLNGPGRSLPPHKTSGLQFPLSSEFREKCLYKGIPWWLSGKETACQAGACGFIPWVRKIPWRREWQPTLVFLPGKSHGQKSLAGFSPLGHKRVRHG